MWNPGHSQVRMGKVTHPQTDSLLPTPLPPQTVRRKCLSGLIFPTSSPHPQVSQESLVSQFRDGPAQHTTLPYRNPSPQGFLQSLAELGWGCQEAGEGAHQQLQCC